MCIKVLKEVQQKINKGDKESAIEEKIEEYCGQKNLGSYEKKVCYFIKPIKRTVSKPFTFGMTPEEICHRKLKRASADICTVKFRTFRLFNSLSLSIILINSHAHNKLFSGSD